MASEFPQDIVLFNILPRLPGNSVIRFKCVSKQWNSFLLTPLFKKMHLHNIPNDDHHNPHKLLILSSDTSSCKFRTMDCEAPEDGLTTGRNLPFKVKVTNYRLCIMPLTSFHGLVCVGLKSYVNSSEYSNLILWNPLTGDHKVLSKTNCNKRCYNTYGNIFRLFYDSSDDDYKLISVHLQRVCQVYVYSLKSDSWRKINSTYELKTEAEHIQWTTSCWLNGNFYFLSMVVTLGHLLYSIIRFNTKTEKFTEIPTPIIRGNGIYLSFTVLRGNIHIYVDQTRSMSRMKREPKLELWRMDEDEKWTNVVTYVLKKCRYPNLIHVMKNGNWLMADMGEGYFYKVDLEKHTKDKLCSSREGLFWIHSGKYIETFVSPNR